MDATVSCQADCLPDTQLSGVDRRALELEDVGADAIAGADRGDPLAGLNLLLVCRDPSWSRAVHEAMDARNIDICDAGKALARLASALPGYSHLLLQPHCDDGLFDTLLQLTAETAGSDTELLMLGAVSTLSSQLNTVRCATSRSVQEALMMGPRSRRAQETPFNLAELKAALDGGMISARYQPIVGITNRVPFALEALARLDHPDQGTVLPDRFVPQIEDGGLADRLTELITERAFADLVSPTLRDQSMVVAINFPLDVIIRPAAIDRLERQRRSAGIPASQVILELTESRPVEDFAALRPVLERLRTLGYGVAIDDVSPMVPDLAQLLALPFTSLKFDKELVALAGTDPATSAFLRDTTARAHQAGMSVVAEGVETIEIWHQMRAIGVDGTQGYLLARPLPAAAVPYWLAAWPDNPAFA
jgi:EAL domain-containing protein (putative c-di-GMP-specific phosphodiesterase class I)